MNPTTRHCIGINDIPAHEVPWDEQHLAPWAMDPKRKNIRCRDCDREYRRSRREARAGVAPVARRNAVKANEADIRSLRFASPEGDEETEVKETSHEYIPNPELVALWKAVVNNAINNGAPPANIVFFGPSGSGKTRGAEYLADLVNLPFLKVDAASMTDPESWFGTREIITQDGVPVTKYVPSALVEHIAKPGVTFIDEVTRVDDQHRNVLLPLTDGTGRVTNPLNGEQVVRHPHNFIIMAGNRGLQFTGTSAVDPAFTTRALTVEFDYIDEAAERKVVIEETGCDDTTATVFTKFAVESRNKARNDPDFPPISTREVIMACRLAAGGMNRDLAAKFAIINAASPEGGSASIRQELQNIWNGVRLTKAEVDEEVRSQTAAGGWVCPTHGKVKTVPAGVSARTGKPFNAFKACPENFCDETEDRSGKPNSASANAAGTLTCPSCGTAQAPGRQTFCARCGATLT